MFDRIVAENGALVFNPDTREETQLADSPPKEFVEELRRRGVDPMETGRWIVSIAEQPEVAIRECCEILNLEPPKFSPPDDNQTHHALAWNRKLEKPVWFSRITPHAIAQRHVHSLYEGEMDEQLQFVFRGPQSQLCLATPNLKQFIRIASGVDDATWDFHKSACDYSNWLRDVIKDPELADKIRSVEQTPGLASESSRTAILGLIRERFEPKW